MSLEYTKGCPAILDVDERENAGHQFDGARRSRGSKPVKHQPLGQLVQEENDDGDAGDDNCRPNTSVSARWGCLLRSQVTVPLGRIAHVR